MAQTIKTPNENSEIIKRIAEDFIQRCVTEKGYYTTAEWERYNKIMDLA